MIEGKVTEAKYTYQRITYVKPIAHHYEGEGEQPYIKYGCPVCEMLNNKHQITFGQENCPLCNVNLMWEIDYSNKENWTLEKLELTLKNFTVLEEYEKGNFSRLWQVKLALEEVIGSIIEPSN